MQANVIQVMVLTATLAVGLAAFLLLAALLRRPRPAARDLEDLVVVAAPALRPLPAAAPVAAPAVADVVVPAAPVLPPAPEPIMPAEPVSAARRARGNNAGSRFAPAAPAARQSTAARL